MTREHARHSRTDGNHAAIVAALRSIGASVVSLADIGNGCPDLLVGYRGQNLLLEVKDGRKPPSARKLTPAERKFFDDWRAPIYIVYSEVDAVTLVNKMTADDDGIPF